MALQVYEIERAATRILADYDEGRANDVFTQRGTDWLTVDEAYVLQRVVAELRTRRGEKSIGYKVGCLSPTIQKQFGLQEPVFGHIWQSEMLSSGAKFSLEASNPHGRRFVNFAIEGEIAVRLTRDISPGISEADLQMSVESWFPVIELHNYVFRGPSATSQELVAGNAMHAGFVAGSSSTLPLASLTDRGEIEIKVNGNVVETQRVVEIPGGPLGSVRWLASALARFEETLKAGEIVLTGSPGKLIPISGNALIEVTCELQQVVLTVEHPNDR